jgi:hypothetical protein
VPRSEPQRARHIALAVDTGEDEDGGFHGGSGWKNANRRLTADRAEITN